MALPGQNINCVALAEQAALRVAANGMRQAAATELGMAGRLGFDAAALGDATSAEPGSPGPDNSPVAAMPLYSGATPTARSTKDYVGDLLHLWWLTRAVRRAASVERRAAEAEKTVLEQLASVSKLLDVGRSTGSAVEANPVVAPAAGPLVKAPPAVPAWAPAKAPPAVPAGVPVKAPPAVPPVWVGFSPSSQMVTEG